MQARVTSTQGFHINLNVGDVLDILAIDTSDKEYLLVDKDWGGDYTDTPGLYDIISDRYDIATHRSGGYGWIRRSRVKILLGNNKQAAGLLDKDY